MVEPIASGAPYVKALMTEGWRLPMKNLLGRFVRDDEGQDIIEYTLLAAFI